MCAPVVMTGSMSVHNWGKSSARKATRVEIISLLRVQECPGGPVGWRREMIFSPPVDLKCGEKPHQPST